MPMRCAVRGTLMVCGFLCGLTMGKWSSAATASFAGVGFLPGTTSSHAWGISGDGTVIVGDSGPVSAPRAFRLSKDGGMVDLGDLYGGPPGGGGGGGSGGGVGVGAVWGALTG